ncbi:hypothetical protein [Pseudomonas sp. MYb118]|uniref:hypothetical protein n=1 Tax=Pseudomonas sp. MYb118 TaxID=1848720 RepID=UPI0034CEE332
MTDKDENLHHAREEAEEVDQLDPESLLKLAVLTRENPTAASVFLTLLAKVGDEYALVVSLATLAKLCSLTIPDVEHAIEVLEDQDWIGRIIIGASPESSVAYVITSRVNFDGKCDSGFTHFHARILISVEDNENLRRTA